MERDDNVFDFDSWHFARSLEQLQREGLTFYKAMQLATRDFERRKRRIFERLEQKAPQPVRRLP